MNAFNTGKIGSRGEAIEDPLLWQACCRALYETEAEFPIRVEGTNTLPYTSQIQEGDPGKEDFVLKLVRPLPHELRPGAEFRMTFAVEDLRYECLISFLGREAYLQYRFRQPDRLYHADRRRQPRYPFRPRENAYVIASDGGVPGLGIAGPLVNISMGGVAIRVDRVLKLDDGVRIPPTTALFDRGRSIPRLRIQDLPRLPVLELGGHVAHATERGPEVILGVEFGELEPEQAVALQESLTFREKLLRGSSQAAFATSGGGRAAESSSRAPEPGEAPLEPECEDGLGEMAPGVEEPLRLLERRTLRFVLAMAAGSVRERVLASLWLHGYQRMDLVPELGGVARFWGEDGPRPAPRALITDLSMAQVGDAEPLAAIRQIEHELEGLGGVPALILCDSLDPTMLLAQSPDTRILPYPDEGGLGAWITILDGILGLQRPF